MSWDKKLQKAEKFLKRAHEHGDKAYARYQDERESVSGAVKRANLFYSGVQTLRESLFNSLPKADVSRTNKDAGDDVARVASVILQRGLNYEIMCADDFKAAVRSAILDRLVPGIGTVWLRFEVDTQESGEFDEYGEPLVVPVPGSEAIFVDPVYWSDFLYEPARSWRDVSWVARKCPMTKAEIVERWGEDAMDNVPAEKNLGTTTPKEITEGKYVVYEIWDKRKREVTWTTMGAAEPFEVIPDPYELRGFFPCPSPLIANITTTAYLPVTDYHQSQDQYNQLDTLYARISCIVDAIKVTGVYDGASPEIGKMLQSGENKLVPVENWAMLNERGGISGGIQWYPVEQVATVLQMLQQQYEATKGVLFEVSGMSDIQRGVTNQYETAEAQKIKAQFASGRMAGYQRDVAEFVTGILQIMGEMVVQLYSNEKLQQIVGRLDDADMPFVPAAVDLLRNDKMSSYRITVQADSLVQADWALEKGQRMELMGYVSQFLQSAVPAIQHDSKMGPLLLTMFKFTMAGYRGGAEIEGAIDRELDRLVAMANQPKPPPPPSPEVIKAQAEAAKSQQEMAMKEREAAARLQLEREQFALDSELASQKLVFAQLEHTQKMEFEREKHAMEMQALREKAVFSLAEGEQRIAELDVETGEPEDA
jgi:hypothetical protein